MSWSELQLRDVHQLINNSMDFDYLEKWAKKLNVYHILKKVTANE